MSGFPRWRYHVEKKPEGMIVQSAEQDKELGDGWVDSPADFHAPKVAPAVAAPKSEAAPVKKPAAAAKPQAKKAKA